MKHTFKNLEITEELAQYFKSEYSVKMGGTQNIIFPCGTSFYFDDRIYYSGRGAKFNSLINHQFIGNVEISKSQLTDYILKLNNIEKVRKDNIKAKKELEKRIIEAREKGVYSISEDGYIELSEDEKENKIFDAQRLANTLRLKLEDALLLISEGKTYVFAKSKDEIMYRLFHPDLSCNNLNIHIKRTTAEELKEFSDDWKIGIHSHLLGQTSNSNHFVC